MLSDCEGKNSMDEKSPFSSVSITDVYQHIALLQWVRLQQLSSKWDVVYPDDSENWSK